MEYSPPHLLAFSISEESCHHAIQLSEFIQGGAYIFMKFLVFLILVIENSFVLFPFFHTADLWILPKGMDYRENWEVVWCAWADSFCFLWGVRWRENMSQCICLKSLLTWYSLQWCVLWGCIQTLWFCLDWLDFYGPQRQAHADWCDLYSKTDQFHPWMICALFFGEPEGWRDSTLLEAKGKRVKYCSENQWLKCYKEK